MQVVNFQPRLALQQQCSAAAPQRELKFTLIRRFFFYFTLRTHSRERRRPARAQNQTTGALLFSPHGPSPPRRSLSSTSSSQHSRTDRGLAQKNKKNLRTHTHTSIAPTSTRPLSLGSGRPGPSALPCARRRRRRRSRHDARLPRPRPRPVRALLPAAPGQSPFSYPLLPPITLRTSAGMDLSLSFLGFPARGPPAFARAAATAACPRW